MYAPVDMQIAAAESGELSSKDTWLLAVQSCSLIEVENASE